LKQQGPTSMSDSLADIFDRLDALEAAVMGRKNAVPTAPHFDRRLTKRELALRRGQSTRTVDRDVERGALPPPEVENGRCFWWLSVLQRHERNREIAAQTKPRGRRFIKNKDTDEATP
jgi:hypothetical protein